VKEMVTGAKFI